MQAVGAWIVCFRKPKEKADLVRQISVFIDCVEVADGECDLGRTQYEIY